MKRSSILIVDDTKDNIQLLGALLYSQYYTEFAMSGEEALEILKNETFDLILLDIMMTGINGYDTCRKIKADRRLKEIPIIFLSSNIATEFIVKGFQAGGVDYISKPFNRDELLMRVETHLSIKKLQDKLTQAKIKAEESELKAQNATKTKSAFLANMSHEIRTPMNGILGYTQLLQRTELNKQQFSYINKIHFASDTLLEIINDILDFSKIEADKLILENKVFNLEEIIANMCNIVNVKAHNKGLNIVVDIDTAIPLQIIGDSLRLSQIFLNLINNAIKFSETGEILFKAQLLKPIENNSVSVQFFVEDNGIGIEEHQVESLFKSFSQADSSTTRKYGGTGLGLAICKKLVEMMNGEIWAESQYGEGSKFIFTACFELQADYIKQLFVVPNQIHNIKTLLINGLPIAKKVLEKSLTSFKCDVHAVDNSKEAILELTKASETKAPYKLVLFDYNLPKMNGIEVAEIIQNKIEIKVKPSMIMLVDSFQLELKGLANTLGINILIEKPYCLSTIYNSILEIFCNEYNKIVRHSKEIISVDKISSDIKGSRILLVEDHIANQEIIREFLNIQGLEITIANNGQEALNALEKDRFDLILMDLQMPIMDGYQTTSIIKQKNEYKDIPLIAITAHAQAEEKRKCLKLGMVDYMTKPFIYRDFIQSQRMNCLYYTIQYYVFNKNIIKTLNNSMI